MTERPSLFIGRATLDIINIVDHLPRAEATSYAEKQLIISGGHALNAAATYSLLGGEAELVTSLGGGLAGQFASQECESIGIRVHDRALGLTNELPIVCVSCDRETKSKSIVFPMTKGLDNNRMISVDIPSYSTILLDQFQEDYVKKIRPELLSSKNPIILDAGRWKSQSPLFMEVCNIIIASSSFIQPNSTIDDTISMLRNNFKKWAITRGADGVLYENDGHIGEINGINVPAIDTLGAGDVFHGAFCWKYSMVNDFILALDFANHVAAESCKYIGSREWSHHRPVFVD